ncbi:hypothetical protein [Macrococcus bovicus]|uniref:hypothetical protein n=1 Tax=Macrococcus bovicus TaxID=69968 RepID=UPI0025A61F1F|nr:hypothetical protein [Macrococcus bovicus]WJP97076.1 hypothetical protein QSV55_07265 [Macrococcus bovicus]
MGIFDDAFEEFRNDLEKNNISPEEKKRRAVAKEAKAKELKYNLASYLEEMGSGFRESGFDADVYLEEVEPRIVVRKKGSLDGKQAILMYACPREESGKVEVLLGETMGEQRVISNYNVNEDGTIDDVDDVDNYIRGEVTDHLYQLFELIIKNLN